jgi:hypothetical protein
LKGVGFRMVLKSVSAISLWSCSQEDRWLWRITASALPAVIALFALIGCAALRYDRLSPVSQSEKQTLTCEQIEFEITKTESFLKDLQDPKRITAAGVIDLLSTHGMVDSKEYDDAVESGTLRRAELYRLQWDKSCTKSNAEASPTTQAGLAVGVVVGV